MNNRTRWLVVASLIPAACGPKPPPELAATVPQPDHLARATALYDRGDLDRAEAAFREAIAADPSSFPAYTGLGVLLTDEERNTEAVAVLEKATSLNPEYARAWVALGNALVTLGELTQAKEAYERYLSIDPLGDFEADIRIILLAIDEKL